MLITSRCRLLLFIGLLAICLLGAPRTFGQGVAPVQATSNPALIHAPVATGAEPTKDEAARLSALEDAVREQNAQLAELRQLLSAQQETIELLTAKLSPPNKAIRETLAGGASTVPESA